MTICPFPGCAKPISGRFAAFCADHHFAIDPAESRFLIRMMIEAARARDEKVREHLESQLTGYVRNAIAKVVSKEEAAHQRSKEYTSVS